MDNNQDTITELKQVWQSLIDAPLPDDKQFELWAVLFDIKTARYGIITLAAKYRRVGGAMGADYMARYASAVMNRVTRGTQQETTI